MSPHVGYVPEPFFRTLSPRYVRKILADVLERADLPDTQPVYSGLFVRVLGWGGGNPPADASAVAYCHRVSFLDIPRGWVQARDPLVILGRLQRPRLRANISNIRHGRSGFGQGVDMAAGLIGKGLLIKGELHGEDDLIIEGTVEGTITMAKSLTIETEGRVMADIETENVIIKGEMTGDLQARQKITVHAGARLVGDIAAPRIEIEDGAYYKGNVNMTTA